MRMMLVVTSRRNPRRRSHLHRGKRFAKTQQGADKAHGTNGRRSGELLPHEVEARASVQDGLGNTDKMRRW